jgi:hypothetical protein
MNLLLHQKLISQREKFIETVNMKSLQDMRISSIQSQTIGYKNALKDISKSYKYVNTQEIITEENKSYIDTINEDMYYDFEESNNNRYVYGGDYVLNFCELQNISTCEFKGYRAFHFEKGKKYKAKLEWYTDKYESQFYLSKISFILYYINDIELGTTIYETNGKRRKRFFLLNAMDFKNLYIYVKKSYSRVTTSSCTEKEKQLFPYKIEYTGYNYGEEGKFFSNTIYDNDDYLILKIEDGEEIYTNFIHIVNYNNQIVGKALTFEYDKGTYGIIQQKKKLSLKVIFTKKLKILI